MPYLCSLTDMTKTQDKHITTQAEHTRTFNLAFFLFREFRKPGLTRTFLGHIILHNIRVVSVDEYGMGVPAEHELQLSLRRLQVSRVLRIIRLFIVTVESN